MKIHPPYPDHPYFQNGPGSKFQFLLDLSILVYSDESSIRQVLLDRLKLSRDVHILTTPGFQALVIMWEDHPIVAFRGTVGLYDWLVDMEASHTSSGFHHGFWFGVSTLLPQLESLLSGATNVTATGHSLGAAMAAIAAEVMHFCDVTSVVNYGQPRIGKASAIIHLREIEYIRFVHGKDLVTKVPPEHLDYIHAGRLIQLPQVKASLWQRLVKERPYLIPQDLFDHLPTYGYKIGIDKLVLGGS